MLARQCETCHPAAQDEPTTGEANSAKNSPENSSNSSEDNRRTSLRPSLSAALLMWRGFHGHFRMSLSHALGRARVGISSERG
jgi:hypothetical protein